MGYFATGVTIVTAHDGVETRGMTANAFMSGSLDPLLCVVSVARRANMHSHLERAGAFGVSILSSEQQPLASHFGGRPVANLVVDFAPVGGIPTLPGAVAWLTAETVATYPCGDHTLFVARVTDCDHASGSPLMFYASRYHRP